MKRILSALLVAASAQAMSASVEHDFGQPSDVDGSSQIWINEGEPDWSAIWFTTRADLTDSTMTTYERGSGNTGAVAWVNKPTDGETYRSGRAIKFRRGAIFHFDLVGAEYLTIRFKDGVWRPAVIYDNRRNRIGSVGGTNDKAWKTVQLHVPGGIETPIKIGDQYSDDISGEFIVDRMRISTDAAHDFPADEPGYWPIPTENRHVDIGRTNDYGRGPEFLFGVYSRQFYMQDAGPGKCGGGDNDSFAIWARAGFNVLVHHGYNQDWGSSWKEWANEAPWAAPAIYTEMGLEEMLYQADCHGLRIIPNYLTDTRAYWMHTDGGNAQVLKNFDEWARRYADNSALLGHNPVDEWDHEDISYTKPHVVSQQYYHVFKQADPTRPVYMSLMGFGEDTAWKTAAPSADILANDKYCHEARDGNGNTDISKGCRRAYDYLRDMYDAVGDTKARVYIPNFGEPGDALPIFDGEHRMLNQAEQVFQSYTGIVAGAQGLVYFADMHPAKDVPGLGSAWDGVHQMRDELFGPYGIGPMLVAPWVTVEDGASCTSGVKALLRQAPDGSRMMIAVNFESQPVDTVCSVDGIPDGSHKARFSGYTVSSVNGQLSDTIEGQSRRVYMLTGDYPPIDPPPIDPPIDPDPPIEPPIDPPVEPPIPTCSTRGEAERYTVGPGIELLECPDAVRIRSERRVIVEPAR